MRPGDKFDVGGKEYTLKDAIEQAGMQLETFFNEDEMSEAEAEPKKCDHCDGTGKHGDKDCEVCGGRGYVSEASEENAQEITKAQDEAEKINTDLDRIKHLANIQ